MAAGATFVGRDDEVASLALLAEDNALITVTGPGGVGKTRFVLEATTPLGQQLDLVPRFVALADLPAGADVDAISAATGMASPEALAVSLGDRGGLIVLDNAEHLLDGTAEFVSRLLSSTESTIVVVTSRQPLAVLGERLLVLEPLPPPHVGDPDPQASPAVAMFFERAAAGGAPWQRTPETVEVVAELCRRIDGLPLAIELAATRARSLGPAELLELVTRRLDALQSSERGRPERHQSVRAAIELSLELLDDEEREVFSRLGTFTGRFDLSLAHTVAGPDPDDRLRTIDAVSALVDRSLVVARTSDGATRYVLLELVREVAVDTLVQSGLWEETAERFVAAMTAEADEMFAQGLERWSAELLGWVSSRTNDLIAAIERATELDATPDRAVRLFLPLFAAIHQSRSSEVRAAGAAIFERWPDDAAPLRGEALAVLASAHAIAMDVDAAVATAEAALADPDTTGAGRVLAHRALVLAAITDGDVDGALANVAAARVEAETFPVPPVVRELKGFEASLLDRKGRRDEAVELAREVSAESLEAEDAITQIWARLVSANLAIRGGQWDEAHREIELAQSATAAIDDGWWGGTVLRSRALLTAYEAAERTEVNGWEASRADWRRAVERAAAIGDLSELGFALRAAAVVAARADRGEVALALIEAAPATREFTVLPELFEEERRRLEERRPLGRPAQPSTMVQALRSALEILGDDEAQGTSEGPSDGDDDGTGGAAPEAAFVLEGEVWALTFDGTTVRVRRRKGIADVAVLLTRPDQDVHCLELMGADDVGGEAGPALDEQARRAYQARILELQADVDEARERNDPVRAERAEDELDALVDQLSGAFGLGGRTRTTGSSAERARTAVTYRIRAAIKAVGEQHPTLQRHLASSVKTGTWCAYRPERAVSWRIEASSPGS